MGCKSDLRHVLILISFFIKIKHFQRSRVYTFDDGTILTQRETSGADAGPSENGGTERRGLGWLSDEWGNPCIRGELITNAPAYLTTQFVLSAAEGYARALAENETTTVVSGSTGTITEATTGDATKRAGGEAVADGMSGIKDWLEARQADTFDAIFVPSGTKVAVHIETQLEIDYDPNGRKLAYEHQNRPGYSRQLD
jgi:integrating conjugative element protein (TIGR03752 family)